MNSHLGNPYDPHKSKTLVQLVAKTPLGKSILDKHGMYWSLKNTPKHLEEKLLEDVMRGWLYLRSMLLQHHFVHVSNDPHFDVVFLNLDEESNDASSNMKGLNNV